MSRIVRDITLEAVIGNIPVATAFVDEQLEQLDCPLKAQTQIDMALDELFNNIASYAYPAGSGTVDVRFEADPADRTVSVTLTDRGIPFDPLAKQDPDITLPAEQRQIGGLGIFLVKKTMDEVLYRREKDQNILTIRKKI